eukprot:COSAG02_NODE_3468_length_6694_cov_2.962092_4_plen_633_part_00
MEALAPAPAGMELERLFISVRDVAIAEGSDGVIGRGALGEVRRGSVVAAPGEEGSVQVALKGLHMLRNDATAHAAMGGPLTQREREAVLQTFWKECSMLRRATHKNIVPFIGVVIDDTPEREPLFIAALFVESGTLYDLIYGQRHAELRSDGGYLPLDTQLVALEGLFAALEYLATIPLIHRDIKPANILAVVCDGSLHKVLVADFGEAKLLTQTMTRSVVAGTQAGTPLYMAPEMREASEEKGPKADVFSAGVLAIEMNIQQAPTPGPELMREGRRRVVVPEEERRAADIAAVRQDVISEIVRHCVVDDESDRADAAAIHAICVARLADLQSPPAFTINVKCMDGSIRSVEITQHMTIGQLKHKLFDLLNQRLVFAGRELENERTIEDYNLLHGTTVHMLGRPTVCQEDQRRKELERLNVDLRANIEQLEEQLVQQTSKTEVAETALTRTQQGMDNLRAAAAIRIEELQAEIDQLQGEVDDIREVTLAVSAHSDCPYQIDVSGYTALTAIEMQRQQIEKMAKHIADLKAAELDLAHSEMESQRCKMSEVMMHHNAQIEQLKGQMRADREKAGRDMKRMKGFLKEAKDVIEKQQLKIRESEQKAAELSKQKGLAERNANPMAPLLRGHHTDR